MKYDGNSFPVYKEYDSDMSGRFLNPPMTRKQIIERVSEMETKQDLLVLLNELKKEDLGEKYHPFTMTALNYHCNPRRDVHRRYKQFSIPKKSGGTRCISAPSKGLKCILRYLNKILQAMYEPCDAAMGFVPGRSIADNAAQHTGRDYVFNTDLKDFFPSIHQARIWKVLQLQPFSLNKELASVIAGLCCMLDTNGGGVLPQGSPCSPILTNIICRQLDRRLTGLAKRFNLRYTRYADDITFSGDHNVFQNGGEFMKEFERLIKDQHFVINHKKTRLQRHGQRQEVTGIVVNEKVNIAREYIEDIRNLLYIWKRYGRDHAYAKFLRRYLNSKAYVTEKNRRANMESVIAGRLLYIRMVIGEQSPAYQKLASQFASLCQVKAKVSESNLTYIATYRISEFESLFGTEVTFMYKKRKFVSGKSKTAAVCRLANMVEMIAVNVRCDGVIYKYLTNPDNKSLAEIKRRFYISLCQRSDRKFWLITVGKMTNEHNRSYEGEYKAKVKVDRNHSWFVLPDEDFYIDEPRNQHDAFEIIDEFRAWVESKEEEMRKAASLEMMPDYDKNPGPYRYDYSRAGYIPITDVPSKKIKY